MTRRTVVLSAACGLLFSSVEAAETEIRVSSGISTEWLTFVHDASSLSPLLGSPTSILAYDPIGGLTTQLELTVHFDDQRWFMVGATLVPLAAGHFSDLDFGSGNVLTSQTFSRATVIGAFPVEARLSLPVPTGLSISPYLVVAGDSRRFSVKGLMCGSICGASTLPSGTAVIQHDLLTGEAGLGAQMKVLEGPGGNAFARAEVTGGFAALDDSHLRRPDLGPVPNIQSRFLTAGVKGEIGYDWTALAGLDLGIAATGSLDAGFGTTVFGAGSATPRKPVPAYMLDAAIGLNVSLHGRF